MNSVSTDGMVDMSHSHSVTVRRVTCVFRNCRTEHFTSSSTNPPCRRHYWIVREDSAAVASPPGRDLMGVVAGRGSYIAWPGSTTDLTG